MAKKRRLNSAIPQILPPWDGPKLQLFEHHDARIQWGKRLGDVERMPRQGHVFQATIKQKNYAVKVFKFYDPMTSEHHWGPLLGEDTPLGTAPYLTDPFYAECRAYGRIQEASRKKPTISIPEAAIPCHEFLFLNEDNHKALQAKHRDMELGLEEVHSSYQQRTFEGTRPRAIVKNLASPDHGVSTATLPKVLRKIVALNRYQVYNFKDGKLTDFGSSWMESHPLLDAQDKSGAAESFRTADWVMFDQMVEDEEIPNPKNKALPVHPMKLRSRSTECAIILRSIIFISFNQLYYEEYRHMCRRILHPRIRKMFTKLVVTKESDDHASILHQLTYI